METINKIILEALFYRYGSSSYIYIKPVWIVNIATFKENWRCGVGGQSSRACASAWVPSQVNVPVSWHDAHFTAEQLNTTE